MELDIVLLALHELVHVSLAKTNVVLSSLKALQETHVERHARILLLLLLHGLWLSVLLLHRLLLLVLLDGSLLLATVARTGSHESSNCLVTNF